MQLFLKLFWALLAVIAVAAESSRHHTCSFDALDGTEDLCYEQGRDVDKLKAHYEQLLQGRSIVLVGMMGTGKTTTGKLLADELGYEFIDTDDFIEVQLGVSIRSLFAEGREQIFRQAEHDVLKQLSTQSNLVIATGGGAVVRDDNWPLLRQGIVIHLDMASADIIARLTADETEVSKRPLLTQHVDPQSALDKLIQQREMLYKQATVSVEVTAKDSREDVLANIITAIEALHVNQ